MFQSPSQWRALALAVVVVTLASCGRQSVRSLAPEAAGQATAIDRAATPNASENQLPLATIITPTPSALFSTVANAPLRIEWSGTDPEGRIREYRYRVFSNLNMEYPRQGDFLPYLQSNPEEVLSFYEAHKWEGWSRLVIRKDTPPPSVTYSRLLRNTLYAFVVVAIDQRGARDATLSRDRNLLQFDIAPRIDSPSLTFRSPYGEVTAASESDLGTTLAVPVSTPVEISWSATPLPGMVIEGYRGMLDLGDGTLQDVSLSNTSMLVPPPGYPGWTTLYVEVQFDQGKRALYPVYVTFGSAAGARAADTRN